MESAASRLDFGFLHWDSGEGKQIWLNSGHEVSVELEGIKFCGVPSGLLP